MNTDTQYTLTQYGGFCTNLDTNQQELLFVTECSPLLAKNRAAEKARWKNELHGHQMYDENNIVVKSRKVVTQYGDWQGKR